MEDLIGSLGKHLKSEERVVMERVTYVSLLKPRASVLRIIAAPNLSTKIQRMWQSEKVIVKEQLYPSFRAQDSSNAQFAETALTTIN